METDHIEQRADSGDDSIENAIPVCLECHAEIHAYNDRHPRGRKFKPEELRQHKEQWLRICRERPEALLSAAWDRDVGPLEALLDELEFNRIVALHHASEDVRGALFQNAQFLRAITEGMIVGLEPELRQSILDAYAVMSRANTHVVAEANESFRDRGDGVHGRKAREALKEASPKVAAAIEKLTQLLRPE